MADNLAKSDTKIALGATITALGLSACDPAMPTAERAREAYQAREHTLRAVNEDLLFEVDRADVMVPPPECADPTKANACVEAKSKQSERRKALRARLEERLERFVEEERLLGAVVSLEKSDGSQWFTIGIGPCEGGYKRGTVPVREGLLVDEVRLGYGLYQTAWTEPGGTVHGDGRYHPGIVLERATPLGSISSQGSSPRTAKRGQAPVQQVTLRERYCVLLDGTPRPP